jgi:hypothetical protein
MSVQEAAIARGLGAKKNSFRKPSPNFWHPQHCSLAPSPTLRIWAKISIPFPSTLPCPLPLSLSLPLLRRFESYPPTHATRLLHRAATVSERERREHRELTLLEASPMVATTSRLPGECDLPYPLPPLTIPSPMLPPTGHLHFPRP